MFLQSELKNYLCYDDVENLTCVLQNVFETDLYDYLLKYKYVLNSDAPFANIFKYSPDNPLYITIDNFDGVYRFVFDVDSVVNKFYYYDNERI